MVLRSASSLGLLSIALCSWWSAPAVERGDPHRADAFTSSEQCAVCHSSAVGATEMLSPAGDDVSPYGTWRATMMANAFREGNLERLARNGNV